LQDMGKHIWRPLWDGHSMNGWTKFGGGDWTIRNGALQGVSSSTSTDRGFLMTNREFGDFTVRLKYKAVKGNSGFFFRMADPNGSESGPKAYEVDVDPTRAPGLLYEPGGRQWLVKMEPAKSPESDGKEMTVAAGGQRMGEDVHGERTGELPYGAGGRRDGVGVEV